MNYKGIVIEESLQNLEILEQLKIVSTKVEQVVKSHQTPWLEQWTLHTVEVDEGDVQNIADKLSAALDSEHDWYADFKNDKYHFIIFRNKVFRVNRNSPKEYEEVKEYGVSLGIPNYQLDFSL